MSDRPIECAHEDVLARDGVVRSIVGAIRLAPVDGYVIAVQGKWGEGKTSVLNMVSEAVERDGLAQVVWFNPWMFSESEELVERYFAELATELSLRGGGHGEKSAKALLRYAARVQPLRYLPSTARLAGVTATAAKGLATHLRAGSSLSDQRAEIANELAALDRPVVVLLDDLDRLTEPEIREMVRLVRLVADLPNLIYVLAFERSAVARALGDGDERVGHAYLEKVVQAAVDLPATQPKQVEALIASSVFRASIRAHERFERPARFESLVRAGLLDLFRNLRDARRLLGSLPPLVETLEDEVELSDLIAIEALRLLEPAVFDLLASSMEALTTITSVEPLHRPYGGAIDRAEQLRQLSALVQRSSRPEVVQPIVENLFPAVVPTQAHELGAEGAGESLEKDVNTYRSWARDRRIADSAVLATYLQRGRSTGRLSAETVEAAIAALRTPADLASRLAELSPTEAAQCLHRMSHFALPDNADVSGEAVDVIVQALQRRGRGLAEMLRHDRDRRSMRPQLGAAGDLLRSVLERMDAAAIERVLTEMAFESTSTRLLLVRAIIAPSGRPALLGEAAIARLELQTVTETLGLPPTRLLGDPEYPHLLELARSHAPDRLRGRLGAMLADQDFVLAYLESSVYERADEIVGSHLLLRWEYLAGFVGQEQLAAAVVALPDEFQALTTSRRRRDDENDDFGGFPRFSDVDRTELVRQAKHYALHPELASDDWQRFVNERSLFVPSHLRQIDQPEP